MNIGLSMVWLSVLAKGLKWKMSENVCRLFNVKLCENLVLYITKIKNVEMIRRV